VVSAEKEPTIRLVNDLQTEFHLTVRQSVGQREIPV
jgi:hypothetical protein